MDVISRHWGRVDCSNLNIKVERAPYSLSYFHSISNLSTPITAATTASPNPQMSGNLVIVSIATTAWPYIITLKGHCIYFKDKACTYTLVSHHDYKFTFVNHERFQKIPKADELWTCLGEVSVTYSSGWKGEEAHSLSEDKLHDHRQTEKRKAKKTQQSEWLSCGSDTVNFIALKNPPALGRFRKEQVEAWDLLHWKQMKTFPPKGFALHFSLCSCIKMNEMSLVWDTH